MRAMLRPAVLKSVMAVSIVAILVLGAMLLFGGQPPGPAAAPALRITPWSFGPASPTLTPAPGAVRTPRDVPGPSTRVIVGFGYPNCTVMLSDDPDGAWYWEPNFDPALDRDGDGHACDVSGEATRSVTSATRSPRPKPSPTEPVTGTSPSPTRSKTSPSPSTHPVVRYANCDAMHEDHPEGVPDTDPAYEPQHDRDDDGWACEVPGGPHYDGLLDVVLPG